MDINLNNIKNNLTEREKKGGFQLEWIDKYKLRELLINYNSTNPRSEFFHDELRIVLGRYLWLHDIDLIDKNYEKLKRKKTKYIDMHTHTIYSDGELTPEELIKQAKENNIGVFSITDHDTINALKYIDKNKENIDLEYIQLIPGVELSAESKKGTMHILGYNFDIRNQELNEVLDNSTSGGIFTHISDIILDEGGVVFGHAYDETLKCICKIARTKEERNTFRGSKYVQSDMNSVYEEIKNEVKIGKKVLVTGTPCQIDAVKNYFLNKIPDSLFTMDVVCHGVPSPQIFS
jgi:hypothetical protein